jgi:hypothetical protein
VTKLLATLLAFAIALPDKKAAAVTKAAKNAAKKAAKKEAGDATDNQGKEKKAKKKR